MESGETGRLYIARLDSNTTSVISTENNTKITDIEVGEWPPQDHEDTSFGDVIKTYHLSSNSNDPDGRVVLANHKSGNISIISEDNYTKIKDIEVGGGPSNIAIDIIL